MKILIDTNVILDVLLKRQPFCAVGTRVLSLSQGGIELFVSASAATDMYYIIRKNLGSKNSAVALLKNLFSSVAAASVTDAEIRRAIDLDWGDFEDAVQYAAGERLSVDYIVTRNVADFKLTDLPVVTPEALLAAFIEDAE